MRPFAMNFSSLGWTGGGANEGAMNQFP